MLPTFSPNAVFLLATLFLFSQNVFSQENRPFRHSNEIGVDFSPFLRVESGVSVLYKHALGKTDVEAKKRYALRLLLGYYEDTYGSSWLVSQIGDTEYWRENSGRSKHRFLNAGAEMQLRRKNFRIHLGADAGYRRWTSLGKSQDITRVPGMSVVTERSDVETKANVFQASILGGISYFFSPRFSVGMEANLSAALELSKTQYPQNGVATRTDEGALLEIDTRLFRLLYLSYHFGSTAKKTEPTR